MSCTFKSAHPSHEDTCPHPVNPSSMTCDMITWSCAFRQEYANHGTDRASPEHAKHLFKGSLACQTWSTQRFPALPTRCKDHARSTPTDRRTGVPPFGPFPQQRLKAKPNRSSKPKQRHPKDGIFRRGASSFWASGFEPRHLEDLSWISGPTNSFTPGFTWLLELLPEA